MSYNFIQHPVNGKLYDVRSKQGMNIVRTYMKQLQNTPKTRHDGHVPIQGIAGVRSNPFVLFYFKHVPTSATNTTKSILLIGEEHHPQQLHTCPKKAPPLLSHGPADDQTLPVHP